MTIYEVASEPFSTSSKQWISGKLSFFQPADLTLRIKVDVAPNGLDVNVYDVSGPIPVLSAKVNLSGPGPSVDIPLSVAAGQYRVEVQSKGGLVSGTSSV